MNLIAAADEAWGIGKDGGLLAHLPGDMKYFRETTQGKVVVMGRKTLESFPGGRPLKNRTNIVLTRNGAYQPEGVRVCRSREEALEASEGVSAGGCVCHRRRGDLQGASALLQQGLCDPHFPRF